MPTRSEEREPTNELAAETSRRIPVRTKAPAEAHLVASGAPDQRGRLANGPDAGDDPAAPRDLADVCSHWCWEIPSRGHDDIAATGSVHAELTKSAALEPTSELASDTAPSQPVVALHAVTAPTF
ncbi:MAG: hypothetical protein M3P34_07215 [Actinomycetota bacterium]|nr:hypothetical protein [Actinomycetota bacterium]